MNINLFWGEILQIRDISFYLFSEYELFKTLGFVEIIEYPTESSQCPKSCINT